MDTNFNSELERVKQLSGYNKSRASKMLDDMATAIIVQKKDMSLDESLHTIRTFKKALRSQGYSQAEIEDYLLEYSYLSKTKIRKLRTGSIYNDDNTIVKEVECIPAFFTSQNTTDLIIEELQSRPALIRALKKGVTASNLTRDYKVHNSTLLINFYNQHKDIID